MDKETKSLVRTLEEQGWRIERSTRGIKAYPPDRTKSMVTIHLTNSDHRSWKNMISDLRRSGYKG